MAEKCILCKEKMYVGEAYSVLNEMGSLVGYVHRHCFYPESENPQPKGDDE